MYRSEPVSMHANKIMLYHKYSTLPWTVVILNNVSAHLRLQSVYVRNDVDARMVCISAVEVKLRPLLSRRIWGSVRSFLDRLQMYVLAHVIHL